MSLPTEVTEKIRLFSESCEKFEKQRAQTASTVDNGQYNQQIDQALLGLQAQVESNEANLSMLRASKHLDLPRPDQDPATRLAQTRRAAAAYHTLSSKPPDLASPDSPLTGLLALRKTAQLTQELKTTISATVQDLVNTRSRLKTEEATLRDAQVITSQLKKRLDTLRAQKAEEEGSSKKSSSRRARELIQQQRTRKGEFEKETAKLKDALKEFIDEHLAAMVAAEDLGGPVVGDHVDISDATLEAGYTAHGKEKKPRAGGEERRGAKQQRIDELVHRQADDGGVERATITNRREAAAQELHSLIGALLEAATAATYIELDKDSAASRFLVKAKIAQFHPRDSRKLRLIDAAREIYS